MRNVARILATLAVLIFLAGSVQAAEVVEQKRFVPQIKIPRQSEKNPRDFYAKRYPPRPKPRYLPSKPKPSRDYRGGGRGKFVPRAPFK